MYKKSNNIIRDNLNLGNFIEGIDIFNSELLYKLQDPDLPREKYEIKTYEYRPDLIAKDFYGNTDYVTFIYLQVGGNLTRYTKGMVLELIPKNIIDGIISTIKI